LGAAKGKESTEVAAALTELANLYQKQGCLQKAEPLFLRVVQMFDKLMGSDSPSTAASRCNLAGVLQEQKRFNEADTLLRDALKVLDR
jgi:tetratricopeptide (TPR) repeat protein